LLNLQRDQGKRTDDR